MGFRRKKVEARKLRFREGGLVMDTLIHRMYITYFRMSTSCVILRHLASPPGGPVHDPPSLRIHHVCMYVCMYGRRAATLCYKIQTPGVLFVSKTFPFHEVLS